METRAQFLERFDGQTAQLEHFFALDEHPESRLIPKLAKVEDQLPEFKNWNVHTVVCFGLGSYHNVAREDIVVPVEEEDAENNAAFVATMKTAIEKDKCKQAIARHHALLELAPYLMSLGAQVGQLSGSNTENRPQPTGFNYVFYDAEYEDRDVIFLGRTSGYARAVGRSEPIQVNVRVVPRGYSSIALQRITRETIVYAAQDGLLIRDIVARKPAAVICEDSHWSLAPEHDEGCVMHHFNQVYWFEKTRPVWLVSRTGPRHLPSSNKQWRYFSGYRKICLDREGNTPSKYLPNTSAIYIREDILGVATPSATTILPVGEGETAHFRFDALGNVEAELLSVMGGADPSGTSTASQPPTQLQLAEAGVSGQGDPSICPLQSETGNPVEFQVQSGGTLVEVAKESTVVDKIRSITYPNIVVQGELVGSSIEGNTMKYPESHHEFVVRRDWIRRYTLTFVLGLEHFSIEMAHKRAQCSIAQNNYVKRAAREPATPNNNGHSVPDSSSST
ncbi:hypothetical protein B0H67DRAFT_665655 [Lasiosphaeris hirsuta]|uniref:Uncharacterized protein n=1 Tax=Lasiosphaeris hirsuta TaxID=260670 RepID=A0AA40DXP6_9PEZI|nr:hypothetical protein B0H67DRAFT_665655 [Lasiosphaeris hirsuta]